VGRNIRCGLASRLWGRAAPLADEAPPFEGSAGGSAAADGRRHAISLPYGFLAFALQSLYGDRCDGCTIWGADRECLDTCAQRHGGCADHGPNSGDSHCTTGSHGKGMSPWP